MEKFDVVIIGAGPAGLSAAKVLGNNERKVLVLEKEKKLGGKLCAGGLTFKDFKIGIPTSLAERIFHSIIIHCFSQKIKVVQNKILVGVVSRQTLAEWQINQIRQNVEIRFNSEVVKIKDNSVSLKNNHQIGFNFLIGADGSLSLVRKYLDLPIKKKSIAIQYTIPHQFKNIEIFFDKNLFGSGYAWIFPHKGYTAVGCGCDSSFSNFNQLSKNFHLFLNQQKIEVSRAKLRGSIINFDYRGFNFGNKFLIGDAGGFGSGLTGEGIYFAIISGREIAKKIINPDYNFPNLKEILRRKRVEEKIGKFLIPAIFKSDTLTRFISKRAI